MSTVQKAFDTQGNCFVAIKRMKHAQLDDLRWKESFNREYAALSDLCSHPNIVNINDAGSDNTGFYMVLEWVETNLSDSVLKNGAMKWDHFYTGIGRPILEAIAFAQSRGWDHRDIKPQNILISVDGSPRISDYGIAKQFEKPGIGITFVGFRSAPFTPPEDDSGDWGRSRDCFSWAALAVFCLTGKVPADYGALSAALNGISQLMMRLQRYCRQRFRMTRRSALHLRARSSQNSKIGVLQARAESRAKLPAIFRSTRTCYSDFIEF